VSSVLVGVLISLIAGLVYGLLYQLLPKTFAIWATLMLASILAVIVLTPRARARLAARWRQSWQKIRAVLSTPPRGRDLLSTLFRFEGHRIHIVYTCRARLDNAECPTKPKKLKLTIMTHVPVDEFFTFHSAVRSFGRKLWTGDPEVIMERLNCSHTLENFWPCLDPLDISQLPDFMFEDLIIIGENDCSNLILDHLKPILDICYQKLQVRPDQIGQNRSGQGWKHEINLEFLGNSGNLMSAADKALLRTSREPEARDHSGTAVAMICYAPNPFNIQKNVLMLYGCHRFGQVLLEQWLDSKESLLVLKRIRRSLIATKPAGPQFGQIAIHSSYSSTADAPEAYKFRDIAVFGNERSNMPFFPLAVRAGRIETNGFCKDQGAANEERIIDISLVAQLDVELRDRIDAVFHERLASLNNPYWEAKMGIGLHVTLYEFATYQSDDSLPRARRYAEDLKFKRGLEARLSEFQSEWLLLAGVDLVQSSVLVRAYLPPTFVDEIQKACKELAQGIGYFNRLRVPFPLHCTVVRFRSVPDEVQVAELHRFAEEFRKYTFGKVRLEKLSVLLMTKSPYQDPDDKKCEVVLQPPSLHEDRGLTNPS
jgi:hypothetical protein